MNITSKVRVGVLVSLLALGAAGCAGHRGVDQTGEVVEDSWITSKVKSKLVADKEVSGTSIHVKTVDGVVTLGGTASSQCERHSRNRQSTDENRSNSQYHVEAPFRPRR